MNSTFDKSEFIAPVFDGQQDMSEDEMKSMIRSFTLWLSRSYMYTHGFLSGLWNKDAKAHLPTQNSIEKSEIRFYAGYGLLKMQIVNEISMSATNSDPWSIFEILNRHDIQKVSVEQALYYSNAIQQLATAIVPNSKLSNKICLCESGACDNLRFFGKRSDGQLTIQNSANLICTLHGSRYMCDDCIEHLTLDVPVLTLGSGTIPKTDAEIERSKMSASIRFAVMERDKFACKACGRTYRQDGVKLHVDHIHPVSKGGKTEMSNLQTLCQDCNLGKSAKIVVDMELWDV